MSLLIKIPIPWYQILTLVTSVNLNYRPFYKIQSHWGFEPQLTNFGGNNLVHSMLLKESLNLGNNTQSFFSGTFLPRNSLLCPASFPEVGWREGHLPSIFYPQAPGKVIQTDFNCFF